MEICPAHDKDPPHCTGAGWSPLLPSQANRTLPASNQLTVLVTGMCPTLGPGGEKAVGQQMRHPPLLAPPSRRPERREGFPQGMSRPPALGAFWETRISHDPDTPIVSSGFLFLGLSRPCLLSCGWAESILHEQVSKMSTTVSDDSLRPINSFSDTRSPEYTHAHAHSHACTRRLSRGNHLRDDSGRHSTAQCAGYERPRMLRVPSPPFAPARGAPWREACSPEL